MMREFPQRGIKLPPYIIGGMIPRPSHIQGKLGQGIDSLDVRREKTVDWLANGYLFAHGFSFTFVLDGDLACGGAARASLTIVCASSRMRRR